MNRHFLFIPVFFLVCAVCLGDNLPAGNSSPKNTPGKKNAVSDSRGGKQKSDEPKPVKMPEIPLQEELPAQLRSFFPYSTGLGNLSEPEMVGLHKSIGVSRQYVIQNRRLMRHLVNHYFNAFETTVRGERHKLFRDEDGRHIQGEMARKYHVKLFLSALLVSKKDLDVENYMKNNWPRMKEIVTHPDLQKFIREYQDVIPLIFTGDELLPQNAAVMLRAHRELRGLLPKHIAAFPYLNSSTVDLMPYVPVYLGDWYPIKRKNASGHNPWSVYKEFSRLVKLAGSKPVWFVPQGFAGGPDNPHGVYALPAAGEYRLMLHLAAAAGVKGIFWHGFPNGSWPWMINYNLYRYAPMGGAGQLMSSWQGISDAGRAFATVGPLLLKAQPVPLPEGISVQCRQFRSANRFYAGPAIRLFALKTPDGMLILAVNQNPYGTETGELSLPEGDHFNLSALSDIRGQRLHLKLAPGDAVYIYNGPKGPELDSAFRSRYQAELSRYLLLAQQAAGDRIPVLNVNRRNQLSPRQALEKLLFDFSALRKRVEASPQGQVIRELNRIRRGIDETDFLLCRALEAAVTPEMRKNTKRYARWCAHPEPEFNRLREDLAALMADYYRIRDELEEGRGSAAAAKALPDLKKRAARIIPAVWAWVRKQPIKIDNPFQ